MEVAESLALPDYRCLVEALRADHQVNEAGEHHRPLRRQEPAAASPVSVGDAAMTRRLPSGRARSQPSWGLTPTPSGTDHRRPIPPVKNLA
jgi:hypothetical protein